VPEGLRTKDICDAAVKQNMHVHDELCMSDFLDEL